MFSTTKTPKDADGQANTIERLFQFCNQKKKAVERNRLVDRKEPTHTRKKKE